MLDTRRSWHTLSLSLADPARLRLLRAVASRFLCGALACPASGPDGLGRGPVFSLVKADMCLWRVCVLCTAPQVGRTTRLGGAAALRFSAGRMASCARRLGDRRPWGLVARWLGWGSGLVVFNPLWDRSEAPCLSGPRARPRAWRRDLGAVVYRHAGLPPVWSFVVPCGIMQSSSKRPPVSPSYCAFPVAFAPFGSLYALAQLAHGGGAARAHASWQYAVGGAGAPPNVQLLELASDSCGAVR